MNSRTALIIGSGIGGLASAIRLALKGHDVTVFERNGGPGGKLSLLETHGYRFDRGPSLFTEPGEIEELFRLAGVPIERYLRYRRVAVTCRYHFPSGKVVEASADPRKFAADMQDITGEDANNVHAYLKNAGEAYSTLGEVFLNHSLHRPSTWLNRRIIPALLRTRASYLFRNLHAYNRASFRTPEAIQLFNRFATYNGSDPFRAPAMLSMIPHLEHNQGTWYPEGGMYSITEALYRLAQDTGVHFRFNSPVQRILHAEGAVTGVVVDGEAIPSPLVVCNADVHFVYRDLLGDEKLASRVLRQERSSSALIFYWGVAREFPALQLHNIFFGGDYRDEFNRIFQHREVSADPTVYVNITSKMEAGQAPQGKENWFVMVNVPAGMSTEDPAVIPRIRKAVIKKVEQMTGVALEPFIEVEEVLTPKGIESDTASYLGSLYGTSSNARFAAFLRHPNFSRHLRGLYFTGGSVHPGGGIPLCLKGAAIVARMIPDPA
jgi:phytoene desaturase